jgi:hypothetical protein
MSASIETATAVRAPLNFAANREGGGAFSNFDPSLNKQSLLAHEIELRDARHLHSPPKIDAEGFELHRLAFPDADLTNREWVNNVYGPQVAEYVKKLTGASHIMPFGGFVAIIRDTGKLVPGRATAAEFIHIDHTPESFEAHLKHYCDPETIARYPRVQIFNVWRTLSPPPQDVPLAICDQRTLDSRDWVRQLAVEPGMHESYDSFSSLYNPGQRWFYFSDMTPEEMLVFKAWDNGSSVPTGCLHGAFRNPDVPSKTVPRISSEIRYFCFFES